MKCYLILTVCFLLGACHKDGSANGDPHNVHVPEPGGFAVLGVGLIATIMAARSKK